jgi:hypothetical protein
VGDCCAGHRRRLPPRPLAGREALLQRNHKRTNRTFPSRDVSLLLTVRHSRQVRRILSESRRLHHRLQAAAARRRSGGRRRSHRLGNGSRRFVTVELLRGGRGRVTGRPRTGTVGAGVFLLRNKLVDAVFSRRGGAVRRRDRILGGVVDHQILIALLAVAMLQNTPPYSMHRRDFGTVEENEKRKNGTPRG